MEGQEQKGSAMESVFMAFNLGVSARQKGQGKSVVQIANELGQFIYSNLSRSYGAQFPEEYLIANTEHLLQIALLGYIIPEVCAYDEEFKNRLFSLIEAKINQSQMQQERPQGGTIITP
ncbi:MAG TPA: hypothetical protein VNK81_00995 [Thermodesulfobacteriota bacterium]|jgi:hypothetical protein|nr:hypothetical protein [Thermodesulfobacteriota bacterium]